MTGNKQREILINHACSDTLFSGGGYERRKPDMANKGEIALQSLM